MSLFKSSSRHCPSKLAVYAMAATISLAASYGVCTPACLAESSSAQVSGKRLQDIKELYKNCGAGEQMTTSLSDTADVIEKRLSAKFVEVFSKDSSLTASQVQERAQGDSSRIMKRFRELLSQQSSELSNDAEKIFTDVVSDNLQDDEVNYISSFYKTDTGQKSLKLLPKSSAAATKNMKEAIEPYMLKLKDEAIGGAPAGECDIHLSVDLKDVPEEKKAKVKRLLEVSNFNQLMADTVKVQSGEQSNIIVRRIQNDQVMSPEEKEKRINGVKKFFDLITTRIDFAKVLEPYMVLEFSKDFTAQDLDHMIAYYEDPHAKAVQIKWSRILKETIDKTNQIMDPKLQKMLGTAIEETMRAPKAD